MKHILKLILFIKYKTFLHLSMITVSRWNVTFVKFFEIQHTQHSTEHEHGHQ